MSNKDLLEIIAAMLRKQDQHSELIAITNKKVGDMSDKIGSLNDKFDFMNERLGETNMILKEFMGISVKQWEEQQKFNERLFDKVDGIEKRIAN